MDKTFKELDTDGNIEKIVKKAGLSLAIIFSKEDAKRFNIQYGSIIQLNDAKIINSKEIEEIPKNL